MTIIAGTPIEIETNRDNGQVWWAQNGAKRTRLALYAAQGVHIERVDTEVYVARNAVPVWTGDGSREASVYLYPSELHEIYAVWLNSHCGFGVDPEGRRFVAGVQRWGPQKQREQNRSAEAPMLHRGVHLQVRHAERLVLNHTGRRSASARHEGRTSSRSRCAVTKTPRGWLNSRAG
jgi:hypothetical protein